MSTVTHPLRPADPVTTNGYIARRRNKDGYLAYTALPICSADKSDVCTGISVLCPHLWPGMCWSNGQFNYCLRTRQFREAFPWRPLPHRRIRMADDVCLPARERHGNWIRQAPPLRCFLSSTSFVVPTAHQLRVEGSLWFRVPGTTVPTKKGEKAVAVQFMSVWRPARLMQRQTGLALPMGKPRKHEPGKPRLRDDPVADGSVLAFDAAVVLPSDRSDMAEGNVASVTVVTAEEKETSQLVRRGLLYDNSEERLLSADGSGLREPEYSIHYVKRKPQRKRRLSPKDAMGIESDGFDDWIAVGGCSSPEAVCDHWVLVGFGAVPV